MANLNRLISPPENCIACPRLANYRIQNKIKYPLFFNAPVQSFGQLDSELVIVGLAPGLKGANQTGRPFTGDHAGNLLYATLSKFGFSSGTYKARADDDVDLINCRITNAVKCLPPHNKPTGDEVAKCSDYLMKELTSMPYLKIILALGVLAHNAILSVFEERKSQMKFGHHKKHSLKNGIKLINSYHCSRYNTNTGRLTAEMFESVFADISNSL